MNKILGIVGMQGSGKSTLAELLADTYKDYVYLNPFEETSIGDILVKTIPAYNINKPFHPKENNWLGYIVTYNDISYYVTGDTDKTTETLNVKCDIPHISKKEVRK